MLNREWQEVEVITYTTKDSYGQLQSGKPKTITMVIKVYSQFNINNPKYVDIDYIGIVKSPVDFNLVKFDGITCNVLYCIPSGKYYQVLMKKV